MKKINSLLFVCFGFLFFGGCELPPQDFDKTKLYGYWTSQSSGAPQLLISETQTTTCITDNDGTKTTTQYNSNIYVAQDSDSTSKVSINVNRSGTPCGKLIYVPASTGSSYDTLVTDGGYTTCLTNPAPPAAQLTFQKISDDSIPSCFKQSQNPPQM